MSTPVVLTAVAAVLMIVGLGVFQRSLRAIPAELFGHLREGLDTATAAITDFRARIWAWIDRLFEDEDIRGSERLSYGFGALFNAGCFAVFVLAEFYIMALTLGALGFSHGAMVEPPLSVEVLTGIALVGPAVFFGFVLLDLLGMTNIAPWGRLRLGWRLSVGTFCAAGIGVAFLLAAGMGLHRAVVLNEAAPVETVSALTDDWDGIFDSSMGEFMPADVPPVDVRAPHPGLEAVSEILPYAVMTILPIYLMAASILAGIGVVFLWLYGLVSAGWLAAGALWLLLVPIGLSRVGVNTLWGTLDAILSLSARMGIAIARPAVTILRRIEDEVAWSEATKTQRVLLALAAATHDLEIPNDGVGGMAVLPTGQVATGQPAVNVGPSASAAGQTPAVGDADSGWDDAWDGAWDDVPPPKPPPDRPSRGSEQGNGEWRGV